MTLLEAIEARHSVRKYKDEPIPELATRALDADIWYAGSLTVDPA